MSYWVRVVHIHWKDQDITSAANSINLTNCFETHTSFEWPKNPFFILKTGPDWVGVHLEMGVNRLQHLHLLPIKLLFTCAHRVALQEQISLITLQSNLLCYCKCTKKQSTLIMSTTHSPWVFVSDKSVFDNYIKYTRNSIIFNSENILYCNRKGDRMRSFSSHLLSITYSPTQSICPPLPRFGFYVVWQHILSHCCMSVMYLIALLSGWFNDWSSRHCSCSSCMPPASDIDLWAWLWFA